jgi:hypothetical protein
MPTREENDRWWQVLCGLLAAMPLVPITKRPPGLVPWLDMADDIIAEAKKRGRLAETSEGG